MNATILRHFPRPCPLPGWPTFILHATGSDVGYQVHPGPLSIKSVFRGTEVHETRLGRYAVDASSYLLLNHGQEYSSHIPPGEETESFTIFFHPGFAREVLASLITPDDHLLGAPASGGAPMVFFEGLYRHDDKVSPVLLRLHRRIQEKTIATGWLDEQLHLLLERLLRVHRGLHSEIENIPAARPSTRAELYRRLQRARDFMDSNLEAPIRLADTAAVACLSPHHFLRRFKASFGETPHQYLTRKRLARAAELLQQTERSVTDICRAVGFESPGSFSHLFRRRHGVSPRRYRQQQGTR